MGDNGNKLSGAEKPILNTAGGSGEFKTPDLGKAETPNLGQAGNLPREELKKEPSSPPQSPPPPPTDFKVAEIWIRQGKVFIDAQEEFWKDKCRAIGLLEYCKDIVKEARAPEPKIIPAKGSFLNGIRRNIFKGR